MEQAEINRIGQHSGITGLLSTCYGKNLQTLEDAVMHRCEKEPKAAIQLVRNMVIYTADAFIRTFVACAEGIPVEEWNSPVKKEKEYDEQDIDNRFLSDMS